MMSEEETALPGKPGILVTGFPAETVDDYILELYFQQFGSGEGTVKKIEIRGDGTSAIIEFTDPSGQWSMK